MFDLGWIELIFCATLALVVVGPREMPRLVKLFAGAVRQCKRWYADVLGAVSRLEREVDVLERPEGASASPWQDFLPPGIERLPAEYRPGQWSAEEYAAHRDSYRRELESAKQRWLDSGAESDVHDDGADPRQPPSDPR